MTQKRLQYFAEILQTNATKNIRIIMRMMHGRPFRNRKHGQMSSYHHHRQHSAQPNLFIY